MLPTNNFVSNKNNYDYFADLFNKWKMHDIAKKENVGALYRRFLYKYNKIREYLQENILY